MKIGFTGTQQGMSERQKETLIGLLTQLDNNNHELHHGMCVGADVEAAKIASVNDCFFVVAHPPTNESKMDSSAYYNEILPAKNYIDRNHDIVDATDILIAAPLELHERQRSGTWATVRYARKQNRRVIILDR